MFRYLTIIIVFILIVPAYTLCAEVSFKAGVHGPYVYKDVKSWKENRLKAIVPQRFDFSCGAASLATLLTYYFGKETSEKEVLDFILKEGDIEKIKSKGISLLELKRYAERVGYKTNGYRVDLDVLKKLNIPSIILISTRRYSHFVVLKGVARDRAYIADPALGNKVTSLKDISKTWNNVIFVLSGPVITGGGGNKFQMVGFPTPVDKILTLNDLGLKNFFVYPEEF